MQLDIAPSVRRALADNRPVVALETALITHGLGFPDNQEIALAMEATIRAEGACPATLGIVEGRLVIGFGEEQIEAFAVAKDGIAKCSRRDLPAVIGRRRSGSLTVAGTLWLANLAGIDVMATGGVGGVHRHHPMDVSADLLELGRTPVACVCAGAKSILDLPLTLEVLESQGVPVVGVGTKTLPAFFAADSGLPLPASAKNIEEATNILTAWRELKSGGGIVFATPVPADQALAADEAETAIEQAVHEADDRGITGALVTPFVLRRISALTGGRSLDANKAALLNNATMAARLAMRAS